MGFMPIDPVKIPQNVYIEDRIVGPLTLRQIIIVAIGCGFSYAVWASISKAYGSLGIIPSVILFLPGVLSFLFAFVTVNDVGLFRLLLLAIERMSKPSRRTWSPREGITINIQTSNSKIEEDNRTKTEPVVEKPQQRFDDISAMLDGPLRSAIRDESARPAQKVEASTENIFRDLYPA